MGVADLNPEAPGILYAYRHNLFVTVNFVDLLQLPDLDIIVNATGRAGGFSRIQGATSEGLISPQLRSPLFLGELLGPHLHGVCPSPKNTPLTNRHRGGRQRRPRESCSRLPETCATGGIQILGVADPNPQAPGMILAQGMGIPTFRDYGPLLEEKPDLILELTGDPQVRESIIQQKPAPHPDYRPYQGPSLLGLVAPGGRPAAPQSGERNQVSRPAQPLSENLRSPARSGARA